MQSEAILNTNTFNYLTISRGDPFTMVNLLVGPDRPGRPGGEPARMRLRPLHEAGQRRQGSRTVGWRSSTTNSPPAYMTPALFRIFRGPQRVFRASPPYLDRPRPERPGPDLESGPMREWADSASLAPRRPRRRHRPGRRDPALGRRPPGRVPGPDRRGRLPLDRRKRQDRVPVRRARRLGRRRHRPGPARAAGAGDDLGAAGHPRGLDAGVHRPRLLPRPADDRRLRDRRAARRPPLRRPGRDRGRLPPRRRRLRQAVRLRPARRRR